MRLYVPEASVCFVAVHVLCPWSAQHQFSTANAMHQMMKLVCSSVAKPLLLHLKDQQSLANVCLCALDDKRQS